MSTKTREPEQKHENLKPGALWRRRCNGLVCFLNEAPKVRFGTETVWLYRTDGRNLVYHLPVKTVLRRWQFIGTAKLEGGRLVRESLAA